MPGEAPETDISHVNSILQRFAIVASCMRQALKAPPWWIVRLPTEVSEDAILSQEEPVLPMFTVSNTSARAGPIVFAVCQRCLREAFSQPLGDVLGCDSIFIECTMLCHSRLSQGPCEINDGYIESHTIHTPFYRYSPVCQSLQGNWIARFGGS
jgi:hypothetical protein